MGSVWISEQTAIISLYSINWLVCITETESVYCAVQTRCLNVGLIQDILYSNKRTKEAITMSLTRLYLLSVRPSVRVSSLPVLNLVISIPTYLLLYKLSDSQHGRLSKRQIVPIKDKNANFNGLLLKGSIHCHLILMLHANCRLAWIH